MISLAQSAFLSNTARAAKAAGHIWPAMAACEAAVESTWGTSELATKDDNLFGAKQQVHPIYGTVHIPTKEFINHEWMTEDAAWIVFPSYQASFESRMDTLRRLALTYPHYAMALEATSAESYVQEVSLSWSTGPQRAATCIEIYHAHLDLLTAAIA